jgi:hypothetical protein
MTMAACNVKYDKKSY